MRRVGKENIQPEKSREEGIVGGALSLTIAAILTKILGLIYKVPLSYLLGDEGMGYFNTAYTVYTCLYLLCTAGMPKAISILVSEACAAGKPQDENKVFRVAMTIFSVAGLALSVGFFLLAPSLAALVGSSASAATMLAIAPSVFFIAVGSVMRGYLNGRARLLPIAVSQVIEGVAKLVLGLIFATVASSRGFTLPLVSAFTIFGITLGSAFGALYLYFESKSVKKEHKTKQKSDQPFSKVAGRILRVALPVTLSAGIMSMTNMIDLGLIMKRLAALGYTQSEASALYGNYTTLAVPMFNLAAGIASSIAMALLPRLTRASFRRDEETFRSLFIFALDVTMWIAVPLTGAFAFCGRDILAFLFDDGSAALAAPLLTLLSPAIIFMSVLTIVNTALEASGHLRAPLITMGIGSLVKLLTGYYLIGNEAFGMMGAPLGTVLSYASALLVALLLLFRQGNIRISLSAVVLRPLINTALIVALSVFLLRLLPMWHCPLMLSTAITALIGGCGYLLISHLSGAMTVEKLKSLSNLTNQND